MKIRNIVLFAVLLCMLCVVSACRPGAKYVEIAAPSLEGALLNEAETQQIAVLLPKGYNDSVSYPVLYFLPGFGAEHKSVTSLVARATADEPYIVVVVNGTSKLGGCFYTNSPVSGNWADFVTRDVVGYVDSHYNTIADATARGIAGHSMGGFGALNLAAQYPGLFGHVYAMSPGLFDENGVADSGLDFELLSEKSADFATLDEYIKYVNNLLWPKNFTFAYASAFAFDDTAELPHIDFTSRERYADGFGNWEPRLETLRSLDSLAIEYGENDELSWIPRGAAHLCELLREHEIPHSELPFDGKHADQLSDRLRNHMSPFFATAFGMQ